MRIAFENLECIQNSLAEAMKSAMKKSSDLTTKEKLAIAMAAGISAEVSQIGDSVHVVCKDRLIFTREKDKWTVLDNNS